METAENCSGLLEPEESLGNLPSNQVRKQIIFLQPRHIEKDFLNP